MLLHPSIGLNLSVCGGLERTALAEIEHLNRRGHRADFYVASLTGEDEHVHVLPDRDWRHRVKQWSYYRKFLQAAGGSDILHGQYTPALVALDPARTLLHLQGLAVAEIPLYRYMRSRSHRAHFACCARHIADKLLRRYPNLPESHVHVLYNAADTELFRPGDHRAPDGLVHLTYHSLWEQAKGTFDLLQAVELLEAERQDFRLHLVGSALFEGAGDKEHEVQRQVEAWAARLSTVDIVGPLDHPSLARHLQGMDVGVFPSNHEDPFPLVPVEMMAAGLPVVAFAIGGAKESVVDEETGLLVESGNVVALAQAIERLLDSPELRLRMGEKARERVERHFTWDRHVDTLLGIYETMLRRGVSG